MVVPRRKVNFHTSELVRNAIFRSVSIRFDTAPPASPQNCQRHAKFSFSAGRFNPGRNYAERGSSLDPGPSDQNPESPNALNEGHRPSAQTGKGSKRHDSAPTAGNDAKVKRNKRGVRSFFQFFTGSKFWISL